MKSVAFAASLVILAPFGASAQTTDQLVKGATDTANVLNYGMGYNLQRFSRLRKSTRTTSRTLFRCGTTASPMTEARSRSRSYTKASSTSPTTMPRWRLTQKPANKSGRPRSSTQQRHRASCVAALSTAVLQFITAKFSAPRSTPMSLRSTSKTGKELWRQKAADIKEGYSMTVAPLVADGVVITGISGAEFGTRGFIDG